ncbi:MAG: phage major capsid protein [Clostridia bacterium]|nr:phage major capsid protein [Clostridia bacterium]
MNIIKRMQEINARKAELRAMLQGTDEVNLDEIEKELRELNDEFSQLEKRKATADGINAGVIPATEITNPVATRADNSEDGEKEYRTAWLRSIRGLELSEAETRALTTATGSVGAAVPTITQNKIIEKVKQYCPLLDKIDLLRVPGGVKVPAEGTTTDAKTHAEGAVITADDDKLVDVVLAGYEVTKLVTISKSVEKMSIDAFENWLVNKISRKVAEQIGKLIIFGSGNSEAQGIDKITWDATNSISVAKTGSLSAANVRALVALLNGGYDNGAEWLMSKATFFTDFHPLMDNSKDNIITEDNGVYRVMGYPVSFDDRITAHEAFLGNIYRGYLGNMPEDITVTSQFVTRENAYDFLGCAMFDGKVQAVEAFVKLVKATA